MLSVSTDCDDTSFAITLSELEPDGKAYNMRTSIATLGYRDGFPILNCPASETNVCENPTCEESDATTVKGSEVSECENNTETEPKVASVPKEQPKRSTIRVCKMGSDHNFANMNNHDFAFNLLNMKIVMDGCGSGKHSEVGTRLFGQLFARRNA